MITAENLEAAFLPFGEIADVSLPYVKTCFAPVEHITDDSSKPEAPSSTEIHRGYGYVEFEDAEDVKDAIDNMDQSELFGKVIKVNAAKPPKNANEGLGSKTALWEQVRSNVSRFCCLRIY